MGRKQDDVDNFVVRICLIVMSSCMYIEKSDWLLVSNFLDDHDGESKGLRLALKIII